ncbi:hypothetical protein THAOC_36086, partial [Thalassiosira oceanica]
MCPEEQSFYDMFYDADEFNQDISGWDVSSGGSFGRMFYDADEFNQDISQWDVSRGTSFYKIFYGADEFNQNLCAWGEHYSSDKNYDRMFGNSDCPDTSDPT